MIALLKIIFRCYGNAMKRLSRGLRRQKPSRGLKCVIAVMRRVHEL